MTTIVGRDCKIEVALTFDTPLTVSAVTLASPGEATSTAHGLTDGEAGYFSVSAGMVELDEQAVIVDNVATDTFELAGLATTTYSTWSAGTFTAAATWGTVSEASGYTVGGGASSPLDDTRLTDVKTRNVAGLLASQDVTITVRNPVTSGAALALIEAAARTSTACLFKITKGTDVLRVFYGVPSLAGETVSSGQLGSGEFNVLCGAWVLKPNIA
ncbi:MAG: hypothetical protein OEU93_00320 [Rubrivivax sp.]|nr:hypothetical protein [Rubrivivax sp.]MDH5338834.1 hypothetical protein [Rubrivivax sp.]